MAQPQPDQISRSSSSSSSALNADQITQETRRYSNITPEDVTGAQAPTNDHVERLSGILLTYNIYEKELGELILIFMNISRANMNTAF